MGKKIRKIIDPSVIATGEESYLEWLEQGLSSDPRLAGAIEDAASRSDLLRELVEYRQARGLTQAEVATFMETTQSAVSELEGGTKDPRLSTLQRYARALNLVVRVSVADPSSSWEFVTIAGSGANFQPKVSRSENQGGTLFEEIHPSPLRVITPVAGAA